MRDRTTFLAAAAICLSGLAAYSNSFSGAFVYDDVPAIVDNPTIQHLSHIGSILAPPGDEAGSVGGRPLVNLSLAINRAIGGIHVQGYHLFNLVIHLCAALALFGILRRTLKGIVGSHGVLLALGAVLLWVTHPLQTEAVTYTIQRTEALMALFYLLTLYGFIRAAEKANPIWSAFSVACCLCGMATKEVMVSAPLVVLLYDRTFVAGSFSAAWKKRRSYYLALAGTWCLLAFLVATTHGRGGSAGFGASADPWRYALTQSWALIRYLGLVIWPASLVFDYGTQLTQNPAEVLPQIAIIILFLATSVWAVVKKPKLGFCCASFFLILAPTSSLVPIATEPVAEHRMYLPLAALLCLAVIGLFVLLKRLVPRTQDNGERGTQAARATLVVCAALTIGLGAMTFSRNRDYQSAVTLWTDTAAKVPLNPRAHNDLGSALLAQGAIPRAQAEFSDALRLEPNYVPAHFNLGVILLDKGEPQAAIPHLERALAGPRHIADAERYLGEALAKTNRYSESAIHYGEAVRMNPVDLDAVFGLGNALASAGHFRESIAAFQRAVELAPERPTLRNNLANALLMAGEVDAAIAQYEEILRQHPGDASVRGNLTLAVQARNSRLR